jgi:hypothetical protein
MLALKNESCSTYPEGITRAINAWEENDEIAGTMAVVQCEYSA